MLVLGEMLVDAGAAATIQGIIQPDDFELNRHSLIYSAILRCLNDHGEADVVVIQDDLDHLGLLKRCGGVSYLAKLLDNVVTTVNAERHAVLVLEGSQRRRITRGAMEILQLGRDAKPLSELTGAAQRLLLDLRSPRLRGGHEHLSKILPRSMDALERRTASKTEITGITTGIHDLDLLTLGHHPGELTILAARSGQGKTAFMLHLARSAAQAGHHVGIQSLEMSGMSLVDRLLISQSRVSGQSFRSGRLGYSEADRVAEAGAELHDLPITIDESTGQTIHDVRAKLRNLKAKDPNLALYFLDYAQLLKSTGAMENQRLEQALASGILKDLCRELDLAIVALSQVKRPQQGTEYRRPFLSDLKESGTWEHDSDVVLIVHRPEVADVSRAKKEGKLGVCEFWLEKQRNGPTGQFDMEFVKSQLSFRTLDREGSSEPPSY